MMREAVKSDNLVGTTKAARMLNLSVGTVQNLVKSGTLPAFVTNGGHRRIPYGSIVEYINSNFPKSKNNSNTVTSTLKNFDLYVMHDGSGLDNGASISPGDEITITSDPIELAAMTAKEKYIFIDARVRWIEWPHLNKFNEQSIHCIIYNSELLNSDALVSLNESIVFLKGNISYDFLKGFKMGLQMGH